MAVEGFVCRGEVGDVELEVVKRKGLVAEFEGHSLVCLRQAKARGSARVTTTLLNFFVLINARTLARWASRLCVTRTLRAGQRHKEHVRKGGWESRRCTREEGAVSGSLCRHEVRERVVMDLLQTHH